MSDNPKSVSKNISTDMTEIEKMVLSIVQKKNEKILELEKIIIEKDKLIKLLMSTLEQY